ncbi:unnamed protein product [Rotaria sordida]|uniref:LamG-like jellyroll fold domain-containing protein n=1 Tax=Rotaria sordida TaxID=392033 RepID=A0A818REQ2_9BILA|nr:unnamed protein product [Rotaria sordida]
MTTDTQKRVYKSRLQFVDTKRPKSYRNLNNSSLIGFGSDISYTSSKQSQSAMKILNVKDLVEIPSNFTVEAWIQPATLVTNGSDYAVFGECDLSGGTKDNCMHLILRNFNPYSIYMGFWADDLVSRTTLPASLAGTWLHVAFVYDFSIKQQNIYRNGYNDGQANLTGTPAAYVGTSGLVNIGASQTNNQFKGLIDHMFDSGPNYFTGTITYPVTTVSGYVNQALTFGASSTYFSVGDLVALGTSNKAFSFSLWVKPTAYTGVGTIVHVANGADGYTNGVSSWCVPFIGFDSSNRLVAQVWNGSAIPIVGSTLSLNVWTHIVETYSTTNGVILYVNGIQVGTTGAASYSASEVPDYVLLGYYGSSGFNCQTGSITAGQFTGAIDEFRIYSRELSLTDVCVLANQ